MIGFSVPRKLEQGMERIYAVTVDNIECAYFDQVEKLSGFGSCNRESIAQLVWAFFNYWAYCHDYANDVISIQTGSILSSLPHSINMWWSKDGVKNPLEENEVVGITNYIDFGFELQTRVDDKPSNVTPDSTFQFAASWQANKNFLLKGKVGPFSSSVAFALKSWWKPAFTFQHFSYQRADPNFVMLTPNKEHLADGIQWKIGNRPVLQSDINSGNFDSIPRELRPLGRIL